MGDGVPHGAQAGSIGGITGAGGRYSPDGMETAAFPSRSAAMANAAGWLERLAADRRFDWEWDGPTTWACEPAPGFPCRVLVMAAPVGEGFAPCFAFTAGVKYEGRYWQGRMTDEDGAPLPPEEALSELQDVLGVLVSVSRTPVPG